MKKNRKEKEKGAWPSWSEWVAQTACCSLWPLSPSPSLLHSLACLLPSRITSFAQDHQNIEEWKKVRWWLDESEENRAIDGMTDSTCVLHNSESVGRIQTLEKAKEKREKPNDQQREVFSLSFACPPFVFCFTAFARTEVGWSAMMTEWSATSSTPIDKRLLSVVPSMQLIPSFFSLPPVFLGSCFFLRTEVGWSAMMMEWSATSSTPIDKRLLSPPLIPRSVASPTNVSRTSTKGNSEEKEMDTRNGQRDKGASLLFRLSLALGALSTFRFLSPCYSFSPGLPRTIPTVSSWVAAERCGPCPHRMMTMTKRKRCYWKVSGGRKVFHEVWQRRPSSRSQSTSANEHPPK